MKTDDVADGDHYQCTSATSFGWDGGGYGENWWTNTGPWTGPAGDDSHHPPTCWGIEGVMKVFEEYEKEDRRLEELSKAGPSAWWASHAKETPTASSRKRSSSNKQPSKQSSSSMQPQQMPEAEQVEQRVQEDTLDPVGVPEQTDTLDPVMWLAMSTQSHVAISPYHINVVHAK